MAIVFIVLAMLGAIGMYLYSSYTYTKELKKEKELNDLALNKAIAKLKQQRRGL